MEAKPPPSPPARPPVTDWASPLVDADVDADPDPDAAPFEEPVFLKRLRSKMSPDVFAVAFLQEILAWRPKMRRNSTTYLLGWEKRPSRPSISELVRLNVAPREAPLATESVIALLDTRPSSASAPLKMAARSFMHAVGMETENSREREGEGGRGCENGDGREKHGGEAADHGDTVVVGRESVESAGVCRCWGVVVEDGILYRAGG